MFDLERPFYRLVHHFITRIFHGAGDGDDLQFSIPVLLGLLSTPSAFGAIELLAKYSTFTLFLMGRRPFDVYRASIPDEYFFITYSMVVTGAIVILKWDRLFPDRQDFDNLAGLPISSRQMFMASLTALLFLAGLFALDINIAACVVLPYAVTSRYNTFAAYLEFFTAHTTAVILSSLFVCFSLLSVMGATMLLAPRQYFRSASLVVRIACALGLIGIFGTAFTIPRLLLSNRPPGYATYIPAVWFLDLHQGLLDGGTPLTATAVWSIEATAGAFVVALLMYGLTYYRQFMRIPEQTAIDAASGRENPSLIRHALEHFVLRTPFQRATHPFVMKTLFRCERHCLLFGTATAVGFFLAGQAVSEAWIDPVRNGIDPRLLSASLTIAYFMIISLRALFDMPSDRSANWIFRSILDRHTHEAHSAATKAIVLAVLPLLFVGLPLHIMVWGWRTAFLHTGYVLMCAIVLAELLLARFRKIPFACSHTANKDRVLVMIILCMLGYGIFGPVNSRLEASLLLHPHRFLFILPIFIGVLWFVRYMERDLSANDRALIFDDRPAPVLQVLDLSE